MKAPLPDNEIERLGALYSLDILDSPAEKDFDDIAVLAASVCEAPVSAVSLVDADRQWAKAQTGSEVAETSRDVSFCAHAILGRDLMLVPDAREDDRFADNPLVTAEGGIRFYAGAPLLTTDGFALGTLCVMDTEPRRLDMEQQQALRALARQVTAQLELRRYAFALANTTARLQELERRKDDLAGLVGGELRSSLRLMSAYLERLGDTGYHDAEMGDLVARATAAHCRGFRELIDHLTTMAEAGLGGESLHMRQCDLTRVTQRAVEAVRPIAASKHIWILNQAGGPSLPIIADPVRLEQVLTHLLFAAVKYTPEGGRVRVGTEMESGPTVRLDDMDMPDGLRPDLFPHLYYGAIANPGDVPGPDRGLAVAKRILDAHHATVALSDRPGDGTSLHVVFPYASMDPAALVRDLAVA
ncbi:GAF domain-containing sensor histidine kinase [Actinoplanes xinjiangensis]|jgi:signal transduction histidine kinase|uniref:Histidine kinase/DNA gyrase B/HSP90-like ATPase n=1 Tax=Actinoplanes xinjiangensis TaxID=512350 RepID=A0A316EPX0_9ACTN|nr:GAF domain-containing sensor histidine kinase [Actinoplanes xinjiangensis]PWK34461.1 histidine kinase/DNA gyrase B/HSP90-like ATPase [Actinoplanes xinjiangensis]GIF43191.1 sensor histidine kinase [Actinoplanes xinjiangensis]